MFKFEVNLKDWDKITIKVSNFSIKNIKYDKIIVISIFYDYFKKSYFGKIITQKNIEWKKLTKSKYNKIDTKQHYPPYYTRNNIIISKKIKKDNVIIMDPVLFYQKIMKITQDLFISKELLEKIRIEELKAKIKVNINGGFVGYHYIKLDEDVK